MPPSEAWTSHPASFINMGPMVWVCAGMGVLIYLIGVYKVMNGWVLDESTNPRGYRAPWVPPQFYTYWWLYPPWPLVLVSPALLWPLIAVYFLLEQICRGTVWLLGCCGIIRCLGSCCRWQEREMRSATGSDGRNGGSRRSQPRDETTDTSGAHGARTTTDAGACVSHRGHTVPKRAAEDSGRRAE